MRALTVGITAFGALMLPLTGTAAADSLPAPRHRVLLLGTFHLDDPGLDEFRPEVDVDVTSTARQEELEQVLSILETFRPTKIAVEAGIRDQASLDERYALYLDDRFELPENEVYQIGFRLARRLDLPGVFAIDARDRWYEPYVDPERYAVEHGQGELVDSPWYARCLEAARQEERLKSTMTLGEYLLLLNRPERIRSGHGIYLVGTFKAGVGDEYPGADAKTAWYNRNLRIFANIQRITESSEERILVVIGAGHLPILRQCVEASPEYELVEPASLVEPAQPEVPQVDVDALLRANSYELEHRERLSGAGLDVLLREAASAQFVMLGEPHNTDQVNRFTGMLFRALHDVYGFDYLVNEQDGLMMNRLTRPPARGRLQAIRDEVRRYPEALHFSTDEELALFAEVGAVSTAEHPLWGVDRVHDAELALEALAAEATSQADWTRIERVLDGMRGSDDDPFVCAQGEGFDALLASLDFPAGTRGEEILRAVRVSREDFRDYATEHPPGDPWGFVANERREELMETRFLDHYRRALAATDGALPRAVAKLGHWHVRRGRNPGNVPTLGGFLVDAARFNGLGALSISVQPVNSPGRHWSVTDYPEMAPLTNVADPGKWLLVDLRPLRGYIHAGALRVPDEARETVFGFDFLLLLGGTGAGRTTWRGPDSGS